MSRTCNARAVVAVRRCRNSVTGSATCDARLRSVPSVDEQIVRTCTAAEAAKSLGITREAVRARIRRGHLPGVAPRSPANPGREWLVDAVAIEAEVIRRQSRSFDDPIQRELEIAQASLESERRERLEAELERLRAELARRDSDVRERDDEISRLRAAIVAMAGVAPASSSPARE
jgi:hypothetical protein